MENKNILLHKIIPYIINGIIVTKVHKIRNKNCSSLIIKTSIPAITVLKVIIEFHLNNYCKEH
jgi:hypothetical protein